MYKDQPYYLGDLLKLELDGGQDYTRSAETVLGAAGVAQSIKLGAVMGKILLGASTGAAVAGNTGNGTITAAPVKGINAKKGVYKVTCIDKVTTDTPATPAAGAAVVGNTGGGTITAAPVVTPADAKIGVYKAICIAAAAAAGTFLVSDPDGGVVGVATVGVAFSGGGLAFTIADGAPDFAVGDAFTITVSGATAETSKFEVEDPDGAVLGVATVGTAFSTGSAITFTITAGATAFEPGDSFTVTIAAGSGKVKPIDFAGIDGSAHAYGIALPGPNGTSIEVLADTDLVAALLTKGPAIVISERLIWPAGATADQKAAAIAELAALEIKVVAQGVGYSV